MWISIIIIALLIIGLIIFIRTKNEEAAETFNEQTTGEIQVENNAVLIKILIGGIILLIIGMVVYKIFSDRSIGSGGESSNSSVAAFVPIWIAVFIPFLVRKKKDKNFKEVADKNTKLVSILIGLLLAGIFVFLFFNR